MSFLVEVSPKFVNGVPIDQFCLGRWFMAGKPEIIVVSDDDWRTLTDQSHRLNARRLDDPEARQHLSKAIAKSLQEIEMLTSLLSAAKARLEDARKLDKSLPKDIAQPKRSTAFQDSLKAARMA